MSSAPRYDLNGTIAWPTMFFTRRWQLHDQEKPAILSYLHGLKGLQATRIDSGVAVGAKSGQGLYESDFDLFSRPDDSLQKLVLFIRQTLANTACIANNNEAKPDNIAVTFVDSWYHITNESGFHDAHYHHGCSWCGIYYLQLGSSGTRSGNSAPNGGSRFYSPLGLGGNYRDFGNKYLASTLDPPLENGMLLLFPSYLLHSGLPYQGVEDRVVLAFNAQVHLKSSLDK